MAEKKDIILGLLGASVSLAGLLLVFVGFVYSRAETYETRRKDKFRNVAKLGLVPFVVALCCAAFSMAWLTGAGWGYWWSLLSFWSALGLTGIYGVITLLRYL